MTVTFLNTSLWWYIWHSQTAYIWSIQFRWDLTYLYTCETITRIKIMNTSISFKSFFTLLILPTQPHFLGNNWFIFCHYRFVCTFQNVKEMESYRMYYFWSGLFHAAQLFWDSSTLFHVSVDSFVLLSMFIWWLAYPFTFGEHVGCFSLALIWIKTALNSEECQKTCTDLWIYASAFCIHS